MNAWKTFLINKECGGSRREMNTSDRSTDDFRAAVVCSTCCSSNYRESATWRRQITEEGDDCKPLLRLWWAPRAAFCFLWPRWARGELWLGEVGEPGSNGNRGEPEQSLAMMDEEPMLSVRIELNRKKKLKMQLCTRCCARWDTGARMIETS